MMTRIRGSHPRRARCVKGAGARRPRRRIVKRGREPEDPASTNAREADEADEAGNDKWGIHQIARTVASGGGVQG